MTETMPHPGATDESAAPRRAGVVDTVRVLSRIVVPTIAGGVVKRRPLMMALAERCQVDRSAIRLMGRLRERHGTSPLRLAIPGRSIALVMSANDVGRILAESPDPFAPDTLEKRAALRKFQPHGVLVSGGASRDERRRFNEAVLEPHRPLHRLASPMLARTAEECDRLAATVDDAGGLDWRTFDRSWQRLVRRVVFGDGAADDRELTGVLDALRRSANWAYLSPRRERIREELEARLQAHLDRAEDGSLAAAIAETDSGSDIRPEDQIAHWLFAYDAAGLAFMRTLALLAVNRGHRHVARCEVASADPDGPQELPYLRSCVLESLRLWPTTPLVLRDSSAETHWGGETLPKGTSFLIYAPWFHRDAERLPFADRFTPDIWTDGTAEREPALVPFSGGPARCPGRNLVLFNVTSALARLMRRHEYRLVSGHPLYTGRPEPATLDPFSLRFAAARV